MAKPKTVECQTHGKKETTFVCRHIVDSLWSGTSRGFHWARTDRSKYPDAWCTACNATRQAAGWRRTAAVEKKLGIKVLCAGCYTEAKNIWLKS